MKCRACNEQNLFVGMDLGHMPIVGELQLSVNNVDYFETKMMMCRNCGLGQVSLDIDRSRIFSNYNFRTSYSDLFLKHAKNFFEECKTKINFKKGDWVLELASNDGYLLKIFKENDIDVLGVDPAKNITLYAICDGIPTIPDFFGTDLAKEILRIKGYPKLIVAKNVLAHVPDIQDFMEGISILSNDETIVSIENPSIMHILNDNHFDNIYHEHYSYLSAYSVLKLAKKYNLNLFDVKHYDVHGGSNRYWLSKKANILDSVNEVIDEEISDGLLNQKKWNSLQEEIDEKIINFRDKVKEINNKDGLVCGYAASGKASIVINYAGLNSSDIKCIADDSFEKQGRYLPGVNIPIKSMQEMLSYNPTDIIIFSWNIYEDLKKKIIDAGHPDINIWCWTD